MDKSMNVTRESYQIAKCRNDERTDGLLLIF